MTVDIKLLGWSCILGLVYILVASTLATRERGLKFNAGNRDSDQPPLSPLAARAGRASKNFLETFPFFAVAVLAVAMAGRASDSTALGAELYFWGRVLYLPVYLIGIPYVRTLVWLVSIWGFLKVLLALF